jgi:hypothetical protein
MPCYYFVAARALKAVASDAALLPQCDISVPEFYQQLEYLSI